MVDFAVLFGVQPRRYKMKSVAARDVLRFAEGEILSLQETGSLSSLEDYQAVIADYMHCTGLLALFFERPLMNALENYTEGEYEDALVELQEAQALLERIIKGA